MQQPFLAGAITSACIIGCLALIAITEQPRTEVSPTDGAVKYKIVITDAVYASIDGNPVPLAYLQEQIEVKADGKLGAVTVCRVIDRNRTDVDYVQKEILCEK